MKAPTPPMSRNGAPDTLPPRPGEAATFDVGSIPGDMPILIDLNGNRAEMAPAEALAFAGVIIATVESFLRAAHE